MRPGGPGAVETLALLRGVDEDDVADPTVQLRRTRRVAPGRVREELKLSAATREPVTLALAVDVACDLAEMESVKQGHATPERPAEASVDGTLRWSDGAGTVVVLEPGAGSTSASTRPGPGCTGTSSCGPGHPGALLGRARCPPQHRGRGPGATRARVVGPGRAQRRPPARRAARPRARGPVHAADERRLRAGRHVPRRGRAVVLHAVRPRLPLGGADAAAAGDRPRGRDAAGARGPAGHRHRRRQRRAARQDPARGPRQAAVARRGGPGAAAASTTGPSTPPRCGCACCTTHGGGACRRTRSRRCCPRWSARSPG